MYKLETIQLYFCADLFSIKNNYSLINKNLFNRFSFLSKYCMYYIEKKIQRQI